MKKIAVVGAGQMGNGIAHVFAQNGFPVNLIDVKQEALDKALATISKNLDRQVAKGTLTEELKASTLANISLCTDMASACSDRDLIVEAATENVDLKLKIFGQLDSFAPAHCILASNTSSISITQIAAATKRPQLVIGMHFMNPVPVMKLVEVIRGYSTTDEVGQAQWPHGMRHSEFHDGINFFNARCAFIQRAYRFVDHRHEYLIGNKPGIVIYGNRNFSDGS